MFEWFEKILVDYKREVEYREAFEYFDADKDEKLNLTELVDFFEAVRWQKEEKRDQILLRIRGVDSNLNSGSALSFPEFVQVVKSQKCDEYVMTNLAISFKTYKQPRKDRNDLGSITPDQALLLMNVVSNSVRGTSDELYGDPVRSVMESIVDRNPDTGEREDGIIRMENFLGGLLQLIQKAGKL